MIFPRLCINGNNYKVEFYYAESPNNPFFYIDGNTDTVCDIFATTLSMSLENYADGYDVGYEDCANEGGELGVEI